ncbi:MAG: tRNA (cytidine(34)-2'-O)-methyltransferase [Gammaproteobacteria bacterium]|nr:tRNA (cytidine(34)-2'-O)-methyltransferase [Gammaproteobacteria bacterium]
MKSKGRYFHIALHAPEIPPNTGAIIRLCANSGAQLHLIEPLGFDLSDTSLKRAGLDYHDLVHVEVHKDLAACLETLEGARVFVFSKRCRRVYAEVGFKFGDVLLFGSESAGLPDDVLTSVPEDRRLLIPMVAGRSLNLANAVSVAVYEAWRQQGFAC